MPMIRGCLILFFPTAVMLNYHRTSGAPSPRRHEQATACPLRNHTALLIRRWTDAHDVVGKELHDCQVRAQAVATDAEVYFKEKHKLREDLQSLLSVVRDAAALCRVANSMDSSRHALVRNLSAAHQRIEPSEEAVELTITPTRSESRVRSSLAPPTRTLSAEPASNQVPRHAPRRAYEQMLSDVVPTASGTTASTAGVSPQPRNPAPRQSSGSQIEVPRSLGAPPLTSFHGDAMNEDDLVVLLLKRQLQRREMELKQISRQ